MENVLTIYIDADGCPVKDEVYKVAARYQLPVKVVANKGINTPLNPLVQMVVVAAGPDEADNWIAEHIQEHDVCITADIPLADRCLKKQAKVLGVRGDECGMKSNRTKTYAKVLLGFICFRITIHRT